MCFKTIFIGYQAFLLCRSNSIQDTNLTDFHYSRLSIKIHVAYFSIVADIVSFLNIILTLRFLGIRFLWYSHIGCNIPWLNFAL